MAFGSDRPFPWRTAAMATLLFLLGSVRQGTARQRIGACVVAVSSAHGPS